MCEIYIKYSYEKPYIYTKTHVRSNPFVTFSFAGLSKRGVICYVKSNHDKTKATLKNRMAFAILAVKYLTELIPCVMKFQSLKSGLKNIHPCLIPQEELEGLLRHLVCQSFLEIPPFPKHQLNVLLIVSY